MPDRLDVLLARVRASGGRVTVGRRALLAHLVATDAHLTAEDLAAKVQADHPDVHRSTIYRSLRDLEELGIVDHVHLGHGAAVYHLADDVHRHLMCDACGTVIEVDDQVFASLERTLLEEHGFRLRPGHFAVAGRCRGCGPERSR